MKTWRYKIKDKTHPAWEETYEHPNRDTKAHVLEKAKDMVFRFNSSLRKGETEREVLSVELDPESTEDTA